MFGDDDFDDGYYADVDCHVCGHPVCSECGCCCNPNCEHASCPEVEKDCDEPALAEA